MNKKTCSPKCFEVYNDSCVEYTGNSYPRVGVNQGDSVQTTIMNLASALDALIARVDACSFCNGEVMVRTSDQLINTSQLTYKTITELPSDSRIAVSVNPSSTSVPVTYAMSNFPQGTIIHAETWIEGMKNGYPTKLVNTPGTSGGFELKPENFPAKLYSKTRVMTSSGEKEYTSSIPLDPSGQKTDIGMYVKEAGSPELSTQTQVNSFFDKELSNLKSAVNALQTVNTSGASVPITEKLIEMEQRLNSLPA